MYIWLTFSSVVTTVASFVDSNVCIFMLNKNLMIMCVFSEENSTADAASTANATATTTAAAAATAGAVDIVRELKGVMRVGLLAKGLLLHGDMELQLVVLCQNRPTKSLLLFLAETLPAEIAVNFVDDVLHWSC